MSVQDRKQVIRDLMHHPRINVSGRLYYEDAKTIYELHNLGIIEIYEGAIELKSIRKAMNHLIFCEHN